MQQINSRLKLFLVVQMLVWTALLGLFIWRYTQGKATLQHTLFYGFVCLSSLAVNYIVLVRKVKYPLVAVPPPHEVYAVPPQTVLAAESQMVIATNLQGQVTYMNAAAAKALGYSADSAPGFFALFAENELERAGRSRWLTLGTTGTPPGAAELGPLRYFIDYAASTTAAVVHETEIKLQRATGEALPVLAVFTVLRDPVHEICGVLCVATDQAVRMRGEKERLRELSRHNVSLLNAIADGIFCADIEGRLQMVNPAAAELFGCIEMELHGRLAHEIVHGGRREGEPCGLECPMLRCFDTEEPMRGEETFYREDGTSFPVEFSATPLIEDGRLTGTVLSFRDVSQRHALERMKDEFISTVSHELRTPLTSIRGALGLLNAGVMGELSDKAKNLLRIAMTNTDRLVRLINDILDLERMESGRAPLHLRTSDLGELVKQAVDAMAPMSDAARVKVQSTVDSVTLDCDPDRVLQVLTNLLSNAIKFSPAESTVMVVADAGMLSGMLTLRVCDEGRGIPAEKLETVFDRFQQVDVADSRQKGGTGLGLAICRTITQQHGGSIWAERNASGHGVTMVVQLPRTHSAAVVEIPTLRAKETEGPATVLVCDDDPSIRTVVAEQLRQHGYTVVEADRGEQAIQMATELPLDAILLDMYMPGASGWETLNKLKRNPKTAQIPVVVLSVLSPAERPRLAGDARPADVDGDTRPEILAQSGQADRRADHGDLSAAPPQLEARSARQSARHARRRADPRPRAGL